ncbi:MAG: ABC transporter ATP-binding protein [Actinomycetota bacterium]
MRKHLRRMKRVYGTMIGLAWSSARNRAAGLFAVIMLLAVAGAAQSFMTKLVIDALQAGAKDTAITMGVIYMVIVAGSNSLSGVFGLLHFDLADRIGQELDRRLIKISAGLPGLDHLERAEFADKMKIVKERSGIPGEMLNMFNLIGYVIVGLSVSVVLLGFIHPLLAVLPFISVPTGYFQYRSNRKHFKEFDKTAPEERLATHYVELTTGIEAAKEVRLFGLAGHLIGAHKKLTDAYIRKLFLDRVRRSGVGLVSGLAYGLALAGSVALLGWLALRGRATIGELAMGVALARVAIGRVEMADQLVAWSAELSFVGERYLWLFDYESDVKLDGAGLTPPKVITQGITIDDVHFTYPGTETAVLNGVSLFIPAGSTIALVGENGAGKSTLVKLLCRFYDPTSGSIKVDGTDLRQIDVEKWRQGSAVSFQDFVKYQLTAREAVGVGELEANFDGARVAAAARQANATSVINRLPDGVDTQLGRDFEGGIELSEGEWQRIALARGSMRTDPALLILDEPTASLDARAEHAVFERFAEMARPGGAPPPVAVLVSHRFSTVRMADLIVVLNDGIIEELGTHDELMRRGGRYCELFSLQASRYD